jgi:hypothetical protein
MPSSPHSPVKASTSKNNQRETIDKSGSPIASRLREKRSNWKERFSGSSQNFAYRMTLRVAKRKYSEAAIEATKLELRQLIQRGTMIPIRHVPQDERILPSLLNLTEKFDAFGQFQKLKARLCASGNFVDRTTYDHWNEVTTKTMNYESMMLFWQLDLSQRDPWYF